MAILQVIAVFEAAVAVHGCPLTVTFTSDGNIEPPAAKFWPVKVNVCGPLIEVGLTDIRFGVALDAHWYVHGPGEHTAALVPTKIVIGIT